MLKIILLSQLTSVSLFRNMLPAVHTIVRHLIYQGEEKEPWAENHSIIRLNRDDLVCGDYYK